MVMRSMRPLYPFSQLRREMDRLLTNLMPNGPELPWSGTAQNQPAVNLWETPDALHVELEVPGVKSDQLDLSVVGNQLTVKIERPELTEEGVTYHRRERPVGSFVRVLELPTEVNPDKVDAELQHGVLTIHLAKAEAAKPRKIQVSGPH